MDDLGRIQHRQPTSLTVTVETAMGPNKRNEKFTVKTLSLWCQ
ncbi:hypothetical protein SynRS9915_00437 [Synechococcus sp. RS9915]|nr:hypothetical protein SynRS9915_00437 [Synechococcus sp. RS9915]QNJ13071.1 hypothetical protein SynA18461_00416 [Synechococcus sp. A18-46.1]